MAQTAEILEALPPAQAQPAGLALLDLNVTATPLVITWDKDAVSTLLDTVLAQYAGLEVQEADVPAIKNEMAGLNKGGSTFQEEDAEYQHITTAVRYYTAVEFPIKKREIFFGSSHG